MKRIMIFGRPGSGKSTFALKLHQKTGIPLHHLDRHFFVENWKERDYAEFLTIQKRIAAQEAWIIDGNNANSLEIRYSRADVCLYFNYPKLLCYYRVFKRRLIKNKAIADRGTGCKEIVRWRLLTYMWTYEQTFMPTIQALRQKYAHVKFIEVNKDQDLPQVMQFICGNTTGGSLAASR